MANSYQTYTADGGTDNFNITIDYISTAHLTVYVGGVLQTLTTHYTVNTTDNRIEFVADYTPAADAQVKIKRTTPRGKSDRVVDFQDASVLTEADLDNSALQNLYIAQESADTAVDSISLDETLTYFDAGSKTIRNVSNPINAQDIATKNYVDAAGLFAGVVVPQVWSITVPSSVVTAKYELATPEPTSTINEMFMCQVGAVQQAPSGEDAVVTRDFKIYVDDTDGKYYIEFETGAFPSQTNTSYPPADSKIVVQNFGTSRNVLAEEFTFTAPDVDTPSLQVQAIADQTSNLTEWQDVNGNWQAKINWQGRLFADQAQLKPDAGRALICCGDGTNNITEWRASDGATQLTWIDRYGSLYVQGTDGQNPFNVRSWYTSTWRDVFLVNQYGRTVVKQRNSALSGYFQVQAEDGNALIGISDDNKIQLGRVAFTTADYFTGQVNIQSAGAATKTLTLLGRNDQTVPMVSLDCSDDAGHTGNALEVRQGTLRGTQVVKASIDKDGDVVCNDVTAADVAADSLAVSGNLTVGGTINGISGYVLAQAGAVSYSGNNLNGAYAYFGDTLGGTHTYTEPVFNETDVTLGTEEPDTNYFVRVFGYQNQSDTVFGAEIKDKLTTGFTLDHGATDNINDYDPVYFKWELFRAL